MPMMIITVSVQGHRVDATRAPSGCRLCVACTESSLNTANKYVT